MDIAGFLLASGFALLVLLLGWSNQITSKSKEVKEIEREFLEKAELKSGQYRKIIQDAGSTEDSLFALVDFLYSTKEKENIGIFEKIKHIKKDLVSLDKKYADRFWILLIMSMTLFILGIIAIFLPVEYKLWVLAPNLIFIIIIFYNLISTYTLENRYTKNISKVMGEL